QGVSGPDGLPRRSTAGGPDLHRLAPAGGGRRGGGGGRVGARAHGERGGGFHRRGRHARRDDVITVRGRKVLVEARTPQDAFRVNADGDVEQQRSRSRGWTHAPRSWTLRVPDGR